ncbi:MAG: CHASE2 domain-containing protein [Limnospira sp.]
MTHWIVLLNLGPGSLREGFPAVTAMAWDSEHPRPVKFTGSLPPARDLVAIAKRWQLIYQDLSQTWAWHPRIKLETGDITNVSTVDFNDLCKQYRSSFNDWLNAPEFRKIDGKLRSSFQPTDEIQIVLETDNLELRNLPWHLWQWFQDYPRAELAFSQVEYSRRSLPKPPRSPLRILAILGNCSGIDLDTDRRLMEHLSDVELVFLPEPTRQELDDQLWDSRGWDILFFAGHSYSDERKENGAIAINVAETVSLESLTPALKKSVDRGLKLAIFNSCDGLGLAHQLLQLDIPQAIVMREPVPDFIAHLFLKNFLIAFSRGDSFYLAVREARERLYALEERFPCASWLPALCQNPAVVPIQWPQKRSPNFPRKKSDFSFLNSIISTVLLTLILTLLILIFRQLGLLQTWELTTFDAMMRSRPVEFPDPRLLIVTVTEPDIQALEDWPISDRKLTEVLQQLNAYQPRAIGLNLYRDLPAPPGTETLRNQMQNQSNLIVICKAQDSRNEGIKSPASVPNYRVGFNDISIDPDGVLRRHTLFMDEHPGCQTEFALNMRLALLYLQAEGIAPKEINNNTIKLGNLLIYALNKWGAYPAFEGKGFQVLLNYRAADPVAKTVTLTDILEGQINPKWVEDKIVLFGVTATSVPGDTVATPYSYRGATFEKMPGVVLHAHMVSQILAAILDDRPLLKVWSPWQEGLWIGLWSAAGAGLGWQICDRRILLPSLGAGVGVLYGTAWLLLVGGIWVPVIPAALGWLASPLAARFVKKC